MKTILLLLTMTAGLFAQADLESLQAAFPLAPTAQGQILFLTGRVTDRSGQPQAGARVEIWQTDAAGRYDHPRAPDTAERDAGFQFYGSATTDQDGHYAFRTVLPGTYPGRPKHIHLKVFTGTRAVLTTQYYFTASETPAVVVFDIVLPLGTGRFAPTRADAEGPFYPRARVADFDADLAAR